MTRARLLTPLALALLLGGCASFSPDGGLGPVNTLTQAHTGQAVQRIQTDADHDRTAQRVSELLAQPLSADSVVQIALLNNRGLQTSLAELGITEADVVQAGRLPNPGFSFGKQRTGDEREIERSVHVNLARLLLMPTVQQLENRRFAQAQAQTAQQVLQLASRTRKAYYEALAAKETTRYMDQVMQAAEASAELARRMAQVGNFNKLQQAREQSFYADAAQGLARAQRHEAATRERLIRLLGLWGDQTAFQLPDRLPDLPPTVRDLPDAERTAIAQRLDVQAARLATEQTARNLGLTQTTRFINVLELGLIRNSSNEAPTTRGWEVSLELPLFNWGGARVAKAEAIYMQSLHAAADTAIQARSEVREAYGNYRSAYDIARHQRDEVVPLRQRIADENMLRYNGMLIGVFELLADARAQISGVATYIDTLRDFWLAQADLDMALIGPANLSASIAPRAAAPEAAGAGH